MKKRWTFRKIFWLAVYAAVMFFLMRHYLFFGFMILGLTLPPIVDKI